MKSKQLYITVVAINVLLLAGLIYLLVIRHYSDQPADPIQTSTEITTAMVNIHTLPDNCWIIIGSKVYDLSPYIALHPDDSKFRSACGQDGTGILLPKDNEPELAKVQKTLNNYYIGILVP